MCFVYYLILATTARNAVNAAFGFQAPQALGQPQQSVSTGNSTIADAITEARGLALSISSSSYVNKQRKGIQSLATGDRRRFGKYGLSFQSKGKGKGKSPKVRVHQKRAVVIEYPGKDVACIEGFTDDMIVVNGNMRYQSTDEEKTIHEKIKDLIMNKEDESHTWPEIADI